MGSWSVKELKYVAAIIYEGLEMVPTTISQGDSQQVVARHRVDSAATRNRLSETASSSDSPLRSHRIFEGALLGWEAEVILDVLDPIGASSVTVSVVTLRFNNQRC